MVTQAVSEAIALTEKKMDMSLGMCLVFFLFSICSFSGLHNAATWTTCLLIADDIIKMSKKTTSKAKIPPRASVSTFSLKVSLSFPLLYIQYR